MKIIGKHKNYFSFNKKFVSTQVSSFFLKFLNQCFMHFTKGENNRNFYRNHLQVYFTSSSRQTGYLLMSQRMSILCLFLWIL